MTKLVEGRDILGGFLLNIVVAQSAPILKLFTREDETLLIGRGLLVASKRVGIDIFDGFRSRRH